MFDYCSFIICLVSTRAVIGAGEYGPLNLKLFLLPNCCVIYRQVFLTYLVSKGLKLSVTLDCTIKYANDLKAILN